MNEILQRYGWMMYYECKLCGRDKKHYNNRNKPGYEVVTNVRINQFSIFKNNMLVEGPLKADQLDAKLQTL